MPSRHGATVSLCMIVRNEESNLRECLQNVAELFDEVIIVDTGSSDRTRQIAEEFTPLVFNFRWCDDFSAARNESLRHATGDWVFWLDADDRMSLENIGALKNLLAELQFENQAYAFEVWIRPQFECDSATSISHLRLFRRHRDIQWKGRVHEQIRHCFTQKEYQIIPLKDVVIEHIGYCDPGHTLKKTLRDLRLLRMDYAVNPDDESTMLHLAAAYIKLGKRVEAKDLLVRLAQRSSTNEEVYSQLAAFALEEGALQQASVYTSQGLTLIPNGVWLQFIRARIHLALGEVNESAHLLRSLFDRSEQASHTGDVRKYGDLCTREAPLLLVEIEKGRDQYSAAEQICRKWLERRPNYLIALFSLATIYIEQGRRSELEGTRNRMLLLPYGEIFAKISQIQEKLTFNELSQVNELLDQVIGAAPQMELPRILRVFYLERINPPVETYLAACRDVLRINAFNHDIQQKMRQVENQFTAYRSLGFSQKQSDFAVATR